MLSRERRLFFRAWLRNPLKVGALMPSGPSLSRAMAAHLPADKNEYIVELGAGTGPVTQALLMAGVRPERLIIIERDGKFLKPLRDKFPGAHVIQGDAKDIKRIIQPFGLEQVPVIISSLPLLAMPQEVRLAIIDAAFQALRPEGTLVQFTYGITSPVPEQHQRSLGIRGKVAKRVWRNLPPARVWHYRHTEGAA